MGTWIAILRGINVSGARPLPMKELRELAGEVGCTDVRTYIQSGNVVFRHGKAKEEALAKQLRAAIAQRYGYDVPTLVRSVAEWKAVVKANPFLKRKDIDAQKLHVTFLASDVAKADLERIATGPYGDDSFLPGERALYVHCPDGYGNTKLNNTFFESKLKVSATTRNWRTVNELLRMAEEPG